MFGPSFFIAALSILSYDSASPIQTLEERGSSPNATTAGHSNVRGGNPANAKRAVDFSPYKVAVYSGDGSGCDNVENIFDPATFKACSDAGTFFTANGVRQHITGFRLLNMDLPDSRDVFIFRGGNGQQQTIRGPTSNAFGEKGPDGKYKPDSCALIPGAQTEVLLVKGGC